MRWNRSHLASTPGRCNKVYPYIHIAGVSTTTYYLMAGLAALAGYAIAEVTLRPVLSRWERRLLPLIVEVLAVIGARLLNAILNPKAYTNGFHVWTLEYRQHSLMGGLVLGLLGILVFCLIRKKHPGKILDAFVLPCACGIVILKIGCFLNGCCAGKKTTLPWGLEFPSNESMYRVADPMKFFTGGPHLVHPTQLYEILGAVVALVITLLLKRWLGAGGVAAVFGGVFSIARWIILPYRLLSYPKYILNTMYPIFYGSIAAICFGYAVGSFMARRRKKEESNESTAPAEEVLFEKDAGKENSSQN